MKCHKPDKHSIPLTLTEVIVKWILSNIRGTPEYLLKRNQTHKTLKT